MRKLVAGAIVVAITVGVWFMLSPVGNAVLACGRRNWSCME